MTTVAVVTVATYNYLHYAVTLADSINRCHPGLPVFAYMIDQPDPGVQFIHPGLQLVDAASSLRIPQWPRFSFQYRAVELACALKAFAVDEILKHGYEKVIFFDSDILVCSSLDGIISALDEANIVLTPHLTIPALGGDERHAAELHFRKAGIYNGGFIAFRNGPVASEMLNWWQSKMAKYCIDNPLAYYYLDQSWLDLVPSFFDGVRVERGSGYNVGHWNVTSRPITRDLNGQLIAGTKPLVFFHFSGFDPNNPTRLSRWNPDLLLTKNSVLEQLASEYISRLDRFGHHVYAQLPYGYAALRDGTLIKPIWREMIRSDYPPLADVFDPFDSGAMTDVRIRFERAEKEFQQMRRTLSGGSLSAENDWALKRLHKLEQLFKLLDDSPVIGRVLRRYQVFREAMAD